jgi:hypothetical protein
MTYDPVAAALSMLASDAGVDPKLREAVAPVKRVTCPVCEGKSAATLEDYCRNCADMGYVVTDAE